VRLCGSKQWPSKPARPQLVSHGYSPPVFVDGPFLLHCDVDERTESDEEDGEGDDAQDHWESEEVTQGRHDCVLEELRDRLCSKPPMGEGKRKRPFSSNDRGGRIRSCGVETSVRRERAFQKNGYHTEFSRKERVV
jgi:hypothetical protein